MDKLTSFEAVKKALRSAEIEFSEETINYETNLIDDGILDSLDAMSFLFELETIIGKRIKEIDDEFTDFKINSFLEILKNY